MKNGPPQIIHGLLVFGCALVLTTKAMAQDAPATGLLFLEFHAAQNKDGSKPTVELGKVLYAHGRAKEPIHDRATGPAWTVELVNEQGQVLIGTPHADPLRTHLETVNEAGELQRVEVINEEASFFLRFPDRPDATQVRVSRIGEDRKTELLLQKRFRP